MPDKPELRKPVPPFSEDVIAVLDMFVRMGLINYSSWEGGYFYWNKEGHLIDLDGRINKAISDRKDGSI